MQGDLERLLDGVSREHLSALDIGCGTGFYSAQAARVGARVIHCVDLNRTFLESARSRLLGEFPEVRVFEYEADLESFLDAGDFPPVDVVMLGSVLQYVPDYANQVARLLQSYPRARFYVASTPIKTQIAWPERVLARIDFFLHRRIHREKKGPSPTSELITIPVDPTILREVFEAEHYSLGEYRYRTFHTAGIQALYTAAMRVFPSSGSRFSLLACKDS